MTIKLKDGEFFGQFKLSNKPASLLRIKGKYYDYDLPNGSKVRLWYHKPIDFSEKENGNIKFSNKRQWVVVEDSTGLKVTDSTDIRSTDGNKFKKLEDYADYMKSKAGLLNAIQDGFKSYKDLITKKSNDPYLESIRVIAEIKNKYGMENHVPDVLKDIINKPSSKDFKYDVYSVAGLAPLGEKTEKPAAKTTKPVKTVQKRDQVISWKQGALKNKKSSKLIPLWVTVKKQQGNWAGDYTIEIPKGREDDAGSPYKPKETIEISSGSIPEDVAFKLGIWSIGINNGVPKYSRTKLPTNAQLVKASRL